MKLFLLICLFMNFCRSYPPPELPRSLSEKALGRKIVVNPNNRARKPLNAVNDDSNDISNYAVEDEYYDDMMVEPSERDLVIVTENTPLQTPRYRYKHKSRLFA